MLVLAASGRAGRACLGRLLVASLRAIDLRLNGRAARRARRRLRENDAVFAIAEARSTRRRDQIDLLALVRIAGIDWAYVDAHARDWGIDAVIARVRALAASAP